VKITAVFLTLSLILARIVRWRFNSMLRDNGRYRVRSHISQHIHIVADSFNVLATGEQATLSHFLTKLSEGLEKDKK